MIELKEAVVVEGRYDRIKLSSIVSGVIVDTGGFRIFKDKEKQNLIVALAKKRGILIFTDSDGAGLVIRNFLKGAVDPSCVKNAYIPQLKGKEKRKSEPSKEGFLGVEGVSDEVIVEAIKKSGATILGENVRKISRGITKSDLYGLGLSGCENSAELRRALLSELGLPSYLSANAMLSALNCFYSLEELSSMIESLRTKLNNAE